MCSPLPITGEDIHNNKPQDYASVSSAPETVKQAFQNMADGFHLYTSFFEDVVLEGNYYYSQHGHQEKEIKEYFLSGFSEELTCDLILTYTQWNPQLSKQVIIPCEGIPVLKQEDYSEVKFSQIKKNRILFVAYFSNCYEEGDKYIYQVTMDYGDNRWKISALDLQPVK